MAFSSARSFLSISVVALLLTSLVNAHAGHGAPPPASADEDWATLHMREEHHIGNFDPTSFFNLHDFDSSGIWTPATIRRFYGLDDDSSANVDEARKNEVVDRVLEIFDVERTGVITKDQFLRYIQAGRKLPDFGLGPGHHGDDEYEYEIHHFEKFHSGDDVKEEDLTHPEDIEHFRKHDQLEDEQERLEGLEKMAIVESNIPVKFRKQG